MATVQQVGYRRRPTRAAYWRRRAVALVVLVLALAGALTLLAPNSGAAPAREPEPLLLVVGPGDTVLDLVRPFAPEGSDPRAFAAEVLEASDLDGRAVRPGAVLRLPRS
ncbi:MAG TPA: hypothetical protein VNU01_11855 [Egibacteraceae bacterium]|nr:hypothetical protein [Egibacteraceae bacterium]